MSDCSCEDGKCVRCCAIRFDNHVANNLRFDRQQIERRWRFDVTTGEMIPTDTHDEWRELNDG